MPAVDIDNLAPGESLYWVCGLANPHRQLIKGDLTRALETWRRDWMIPEEPDLIEVHITNAFLEEEAQGIPFKATHGGAAAWGIYLRYPGKPGKPAPVGPMAPTVELPAVTVSPSLGTMRAETAAAVLELSGRGAEMLETVVNQETSTLQAVSKIDRQHHRGRGRPRVVVWEQMVLPGQEAPSLRKRARVAGVSAATILRRDRENAKTH